MITKVSRHCPICGKHIETKGNYMNRIIIHDLNYWQLQIHGWKEHKKRVIEIKWMFLSPLVILLGLIIRVIMAVLWCVTLPVWILHEICE